MNIKVMSREEIDVVRERNPYYNKLSAYVEEFVNSGAFGAEVEFSTAEYKTPQACYQSLKDAIRRAHKNNLQVFTRKGHVYIINELAK